MCMGGRGKSFIKNTVPKVAKMPSAKIAKPVVKKTTEVKENIVKATPVAKITKTSTDTALRDIKDLIKKGILQQTKEGGRNANYELSSFK